MAPKRTENAVFCILPASEVKKEHLEASAKLFSEHYGKWGENPCGLKVGGQVRMSPKKLAEELLFDPSTCSLVQALLGEDLIGHAFVCRFQIADKGQVSWITQLVVHSTYRGMEVAKQLCRHAWGAKGKYFASGLVTSHPYAVRALEHATERACDRGHIARFGSEILASSGIPYVQGKELIFEGGKTLINTGFFVDHADVNSLLAKPSLEWTLGPLEDGHEFFAFTFADSPKSSPSGSPRLHEHV